MRLGLGKGPRSGAGTKSLPYRNAACNGGAALQHWTKPHFHDNAMTRGRCHANSAARCRNRGEATGKEP